MNELYSSGGRLRSVPGSNRSLSCGDCPEDTLDGAVRLVCRVLILSDPSVLCDSVSEPGANESTGEIDCELLITYGDDSGTAYALSGGAKDCWVNDVCSGIWLRVGKRVGGG
jgi:hypothetical protein